MTSILLQADFFFFLLKFEFLLYFPENWNLSQLSLFCKQFNIILIINSEKWIKNLMSFLTHQNQVDKNGKDKVPPLGGIKKESKCFFCKKKGHKKKDCTKFKKWLESKGNSISCVCYESNMVDVNHNTWWIDSGSTIYISNTLQGMQNLRKLVGSE